MLNLIAQIDIGESILVDGERSLQDLYPNVGSLVNLIVFNVFILAGIIFLFLLILGGFSIISGDSSKGVEDGKKKITTAVIGLVIMFSAYWIIQIIELLTGITILGGGASPVVTPGGPI